MWNLSLTSQTEVEKTITQKFCNANIFMYTLQKDK